MQSDNNKEERYKFDKFELVNTIDIPFLYVHLNKNYDTGTLEFYLYDRSTKFEKRKGLMVATLQRGDRVEFYGGADKDNITSNLFINFDDYY